MKKDFFMYIAPTAVNLSACSMCQLSCPACDPQFGIKKKNILGWGFLLVKEFMKFVDNNPQIRNIELAHSGEIFLNRELQDIVRYAFEKKVALTALTGVNLNNISADMCESLVKYQFKGLKIAIDGTDDKVYAMYRRGGSFSQVIKNIKLINFYKKEYRSQYPFLQWQFIPFGHNEHQIVQAKKMARALGMEFKVKFNASATFSPIRQGDLIRKESSFGCATREEFSLKYGKIFALSCHELWTSPQINWDGKLLGCCANLFVDMGNVFRIGLWRALSSKRYVETKKVVLGIKEPTKDIPCYSCPVYRREGYSQKRIQSTLASLVEKKYFVNTLWFVSAVGAVFTCGLNVV